MKMIYEYDNVLIGDRAEISLPTYNAGNSFKVPEGTKSIVVIVQHKFIWGFKDSYDNEIYYNEIVNLMTRESNPEYFL